MASTLPVHSFGQSQHTRMGKLLPWLVPLGGLLLSFGFPNEILHGKIGDRPPAVLAWVALIPLLWAVLALPRRQARWAVWGYGFVFSIAQLSWMRLFGYLPWVLLAAYLSLTPLLALLITERFSARRVLVPLVFAAAWTGLEWLRGQGMFGFPWAEIGTSQVEGLPARIAALGGIPLVTFLLLWVVGASVLFAIDRKPPSIVSVPVAVKSRWALPIAIIVFLLCLAGGWWQVRQTTTRWRHGAAAVHVAVIQPCTEKGLMASDFTRQLSDAEYAQRCRVRLDALLMLSHQAMGGVADTASASRLTIWPESALSEQPTDFVIANLCRGTQSALIVGAPAYRWLSTNQCEPLNSAYLFGSYGEVLGQYDKIHLVPFGEFVPFRQFVARYYSVRDTDLARGNRRLPLTLDGHRIGVGICFESTFSDIARDYARQGTELLVYITNDAWFHQTSAVRQHFNHARYRAIETGLPVARAAATGISGIIAPDGHIVREIATYQTGAHAETIPYGIAGTLYTRGGWLFGPCCLLATILALLARLRWRKRVNTVSHPPA